MNTKIAEDILRIRLSQILVNEEYKAGKFKIPVHLSFGHEAIAVAVSSVLEENDKLILSHRNMAYNLARLGHLRPIMDEYCLKGTGLAKGKLGSMNLINPERNIIYSSSILGNSFPVSAGVAMAEKIKGTKGVTLVLGGDGAIEEGSLYESLVMMRWLGLSVIVIIENNEWSLGTHITERREAIDLSKLTEAVGVSYLKLEGNNVDNYISVLKKTKVQVLSKIQPICIEVILKTLGDRRNPPTPEYPEGKYINYHAGPSSTVDIAKVPETGILKEDRDDPVFVVSQIIGKDKLVEMSSKIMTELKKELN